MLLVTLVLVVTAGGAALALTTEVTPSPPGDQVLRGAVRATLASSGFDFHRVGATATGTYRAPDNVYVDIPGHHSSETEFFVLGFDGSGPDAYVRAQMDGSFYPDVPPLASVARATDVVRLGDTFTFVIPAIALAQPMGLRPSTVVARDTQASVVVRNGRVVQLDLPRGIHASGLRYGPAQWDFTGFETSS